MTNEQIYQIALTMTNGIGNVLSRQLLSYFGSAEAIFKENRRSLEKVPGIGRALSLELNKQETLKKAEEEIEFIEKNNIKVFFLNDKEYPKRLKECNDAPFVFYYKGNANLNAEKIISIVGTRQATSYGLENTNQIISDLATVYPELVIVSGLAYGIDICAHRTALKTNLQTVGVLAHGLDRIYPQTHKSTALEMLNHGGLLTDFPQKTEPEKSNFLKRNRIIAGLSDATIVMESSNKGGSLVTADIAFSYGRDVYSFPGRVTDNRSKGCNELIRKNKAGLITSANDLIEALCWDQKTIPLQKELPFEVENSVNDPILSNLKKGEKININELAFQIKIPIQELSVKLFEMEIEGIIEILPGNICRRK